MRHTDTKKKIETIEMRKNLATMMAAKSVDEKRHKIEMKYATVMVWLYNAMNNVTMSNDGCLQFTCHII